MQKNSCWDGNVLLFWSMPGRLGAIYHNWQRVVISGISVDWPLLRPF